MVIDINQHRDSLKFALWAAIIALVLVVPPVWPYGFYNLLRLIVTAAAIYAIIVLRQSSPVDAVVLGFVALAFNPIIPIFLPKAMWVVVDLGTAGYFWSLVNRHLTIRENQ